MTNNKETRDTWKAYEKYADKPTFVRKTPDESNQELGKWQSLTNNEKDSDDENSWE